MGGGRFAGGQANWPHAHQPDRRATECNQWHQSGDEKGSEEAVALTAPINQCNELIGLSKAP